MGCTRQCAVGAPVQADGRPGPPAAQSNGTKVGAELPFSDEVPELDVPGLRGIQSSYPTKWIRMTLSPNLPTGGVDGMRVGDGKSKISIACPAFAAKYQYSMALGRRSGLSIQTQQVRNCEESLDSFDAEWLSSLSKMHLSP